MHNNIYTQCIYVYVHVHVHVFCTWCPFTTVPFFHSGKKITTCCLSQLTGHFYIGTDGGNIYTLDVRLFELMDNDAVLWEKATAL